MPGSAMSSAPGESGPSRAGWHATCRSIVTGVRDLVPSISVPWWDHGGFQRNTPTRARGCLRWAHRIVKQRIRLGFPRRCLCGWRAASTTVTMAWWSTSGLICGRARCGCDWCGRVCIWFLGTGSDWQAMRQPPELAGQTHSGDTTLGRWPSVTSWSRGRRMQPTRIEPPNQSRRTQRDIERSDRPLLHRPGQQIRHPAVPTPSSRPAAASTPIRRRWSWPRVVPDDRRNGVPGAGGHVDGRGTDHCVAPVSGTAIVSPVVGYMGSGRSMPRSVLSLAMIAARPRSGRPVPGTGRPCATTIRNCGNRVRPGTIGAVIAG